VPETFKSLAGRSLAGRTFRWRFAEGPTAGKTYEHTFHPDGTVVWREVGGNSGNPQAAQDKPKPESGVKYASFEVAPETHLVSYLSGSGYTLTVAMNLDTLRCWGVASNDKQWYPLTGTLETVEKGS